jgi:hypothetical protein
MKRLALTLLLAASTVLAADPFLGTWKLNLSKSRFPNDESMKELTITWAANGDKLRVSGVGASADGRPMRYSYDPIYDGKDYPPAGAWNWDSVSNNQVDENTREDRYKKNGRIIRVERRTVSTDGKTLTYAIEAETNKGPVKGLLVFDRVN